VRKFGAGFAHRAKAARRKPGTTSHLDEVLVTLRGEPYLLRRADDQHGVELDIVALFIFVANLVLNAFKYGAPADTDRLYIRRDRHYASRLAGSADNY
jgi:two-component sensor histidine kinase